MQTVEMDEPIIRPHGNYRDLKAFQMAEIVYDGTVVFCRRFRPNERRMTEQMVQAARSGRQNIAEGNMVSATSSKSEMMLIAVAIGSLEELMLDYQDFLRQNNLEHWSKSHPKAVFIRKLATKPNRTYETYKTYLEDKTAETAANTLICLINQTTYLLNRVLRQLENRFREEGGFTERLYRARKQGGPNP